MDAQLLRAYRHARREPWNQLTTTPAKWALVRARGELRGWELASTADQETKFGDWSNHWRVDIGPGCWVDVWQVPDDDCDCWEWAKEYPRDDGQEDDIPESHWHYGIVAETRLYGREVAYDACWGYTAGWPGQSNEAELAYAYGEIADHAIDQAREMYAQVPQWVRHSLAIAAGEE